MFISSTLVDVVVQLLTASDCLRLPRTAALGLVPHHLPEFAHIHVHCVGDAT